MGFLAAAPPPEPQGSDVAENLPAISGLLKIALILLGCAVLIGGIIAFIALRRAPNGMEDDEGFHRIDQPKR